MATHLKYFDKRDWADEDITMPRGDNRHVRIPHDLGPGSAIKEARFWVVDSSGTAVLQKSLDEHPTQWNTSTPNLVLLELDDLDTRGLPLGGYSHGAELVDQNDRVVTYLLGTLTLIDDVVADTNDTAAYLSYYQRQTYHTSNSQLLATVDATYVATAAAASVTDLVIDDASLFSATDVVFIALTAGGYDERTISSISSNTLTLSSGLSGAVAADNIVRLKV